MKLSLSYCDTSCIDLKKYLFMRVGIDLPRLTWPVLVVKDLVVLIF